MQKRLASLSLDLDNKWSYMKTHGDAGWESFPSYLDIVVPRVLEFLEERRLKITFFVVGQDAALEKNHAALRSLADAGHEIGNHSFNHEPWLHLYSPEEISEEFSRAEQAIETATGERTVGFRGPGFSFSEQVLKELATRRYWYDASTFPTFLGPIARLYYFFSSNLSKQERADRKQLFGKMSEGFRPLRPYRWNTSGRRSGRDPRNDDAHLQGADPRQLSALPGTVLPRFGDAVLSNGFWTVPPDAYRTLSAAASARLHGLR